jgi:hypothetical protein
MFKLLITGSRDLCEACHYPIMAFEINSSLMASEVLIIQGGASGADSLAKLFAKRHGYHCATIPAQWKLLKASAGPRRNRAMLSLMPDVVWAFHTDQKLGKGTRDCVDQAHKQAKADVRISILKPCVCVP